MHFLYFDVIKRCFLEIPVDTALSLHKSEKLNKTCFMDGRFRSSRPKRALGLDSTGLAFVFQNFSLTKSLLHF